LIKNKDRTLVTAPRLLSAASAPAVSVHHRRVTRHTCVDGERATRPNPVMGTTSADYPLAVRPAGPCWRPPQVRGLRRGVRACHRPESSRSRGRGAVSARRPRASRCQAQAGFQGEAPCRRRRGRLRSPAAGAPSPVSPRGSESTELAPEAPRAGPRRGWAEVANELMLVLSLEN